MNIVSLNKIEHSVKIGDVCDPIEPNITEDTMFVDGNEVVGFYLKEITGKLKEFIEIANAELLTDRVPKTAMNRGPVGSKQKQKERAAAGINMVSQFSTIIGACAPRPHMRMPYPRMSSVHEVKTAQTFIKAMLLACREAEEVIKEIAPSIYDQQLALIENHVPPKFRFGKLFTSSISNFNISAPFHRDAGNLEGCVNVIITKKHNAKGGNLSVPDYNATVDSRDNSMLVYPAWRNIHGVTPIRPIQEGGYRNSLVFYPLKAFNNYWND
jgi:hypothetical protein